MNEIKSFLMNYKTSIPALLGLSCVGLYFLNLISQEQLITGVGVLTSLGLLAAKDHQ